MSYKSIIFWPKESGIHVSSDTHRDSESAAHVCNTINALGMGCDGEIFPTKTFVLPAVENIETRTETCDYVNADELPDGIATRIWDGDPAEVPTLFVVDLNDGREETAILKELLPREVALRNNLIISYEVN